MLKLNLKNIFVIDGVGSLLSSVLTGLVLPLLSNLVGLPVSVLHGLGFLALTFSAYSLGCFFFVKNHKLWMLTLIVVANLFYCAISIRLMVTSEQITDLGTAVLIAEILAILGVVALELKVYRSHVIRPVS